MPRFRVKSQNFMKNSFRKAGLQYKNQNRTVEYEIEGLTTITVIRTTEIKGDKLLCSEVHIGGLCDGRVQEVAPQRIPCCD
jgi:hypothetical protein